MTLLEQIVAARRVSLAKDRAARAAAGLRPASEMLLDSGSEASRRHHELPNTTTGHAGSGTIDRGRGATGDLSLPENRAEPASPRASPRTHAFRAALEAPGRRIITEIKRRSPSAGRILNDLDPGDLAHRFSGAGAAALSVLTEPDFFGGSDADLIAAKGACGLPILRKDFILDREQVFESRALGADAILLIASILSAAELCDLTRAAEEAGVDALVEVHSESELEAALAASATIIGVNSRDLRDFSVDLGRAQRLAARLPDGVVRVAESGIHGREDIARLESAGFRAFLVGEWLLRAPDPGAALESLIGV